MAEKIRNIILDAMAKGYSPWDCDKVADQIKQILHRKVGELDIHDLAKQAVYKVIEEG